MSTSPPHSEDLEESIEQIRVGAGAETVALALYDYETRASFAVAGDEWFHAASTIKVPVLVGVFAAVESGELTLDSRVHVRNRFISAADDTAYRVEGVRDAGSEVHAYTGKTMRVRELARQMIVTSSNLATNLLVDLIGTEELRRTLARIGAEGIDLRRGVEDDQAYEAGINNLVTASGLVGILRLIEEEKVLSPGACREMLEILHEQEFRSGIPAGVPEGTRVANKTGEISTMAHDTGLIYLPDREPYALAILTRWDAADTSGRRETVAALSRAVYAHLTDDGGR